MFVTFVFQKSIKVCKCFGVFGCNTMVIEGI